MSYFFGGISRGDKLIAAQALLEAIQNNTDLPVRNPALSQGELGKLFAKAIRFKVDADRTTAASMPSPG